MARFPTSILYALLCAMALGCVATASGQCTNTSSYGSAVAPTSTTPVTTSTCNFQSEYSTVTGLVAGNTYTASSSCGGYVTVRRGTYNGTLVANGNAPLSFTAPVAGTYYLHWNTNAACGTASTCCVTTIACTSCVPTPPTGCTNTTAYGSVAAPTNATPVTIATCNFQSEYSTVTGVVAGSIYTATSSCGGYVTVRRGTYNGTLVANGNAPLTFTAPVAGTYYLHWNTNAACGTASTCCVTTIACTSCSAPAGGCTNTTAYGSVAAPTNTAPVTISTCNFQSEYSTITGVVAGSTYTATSSCGGYVTVRRGTYNGTLVAHGNAPLTFTAPVAGTYYLHWNTNAACGTASNCCVTTIACTSCSAPVGGCTNTTSYGSVPAPTGYGSVTITSCSYQTEFSTITGVVAGNTYTASSDCGGFITVRRDTYNGTLVISGNSALTFTAPTSGTYYLHWNTNAACGTASTCCITEIACTSCASNPVTASDCVVAVPVCTNIAFQVDPNGYGNTNEIPPLGSYGNPDYGWGSMVPPYYNSWGTDNEGCLRNGELNSTWMVVNVLTGGSLAFTFGGLGTQAGYYDWAMYPYGANACTAVAANALAPVRCNWNGVSYGGTGLAATLPAGGDASNFEPPFYVGSSTQWLICFSNWSSVTTSVPLQFGGTAVVSCSPLPVELLSFEAKATELDVALEWVTATELNSSHYDVERSKDAQSWGKLDVVHAAGNSQMPIRYAITDHAPLSGMSYYRLRIVDLDGSFTFSPEVPVQMIQNVLLCYPNPSNGAFTVSSFPDGAVIDVRDALGRLVAVDVLPGATGSAHVKLRSPTPGLYSVHVSYNAVVVTAKVLIAEQ